ncbi:unnamed protein product, partial [Sphenostylis stenocarpa]
MEFIRLPKTEKDLPQQKTEFTHSHDKSQKRLPTQRQSLPDILLEAKKTSYMKIKLQRTHLGINLCPKKERKASRGPRTRKLDKTGRDHGPKSGTAVPTVILQLGRASRMWDGRPKPILSGTAVPAFLGVPLCVILLFGTAIPVQTAVPTQTAVPNRSCIGEERLCRERGCQNASSQFEILNIKLATE